MLKRTRVLKGTVIPTFSTVSRLYKNVLHSTQRGIGKERGTDDKSAECDNNTI